MRCHGTVLTVRSSNYYPTQRDLNLLGAMCGQYLTHVFGPGKLRWSAHCPESVLIRKLSRNH